MNIQRLTLIIDSLPDGGFLIVDPESNTPRMAVSSANELLLIMQQQLHGFATCNPGAIPPGVRPDARTEDHETMHQPGKAARLVWFGGRRA